MKRYNLLTTEDLIRGESYECITLWGNNPNPRRESVLYNKQGSFQLPDDHRLLEVIDNSVMLVLARRRYERYKEIVCGGYHEDGEYNNERCSTSLKDCELLFPV